MILHDLSESKAWQQLQEMSRKAGRKIGLFEGILYRPLDEIVAESQRVYEKGIQEGQRIAKKEIAKKLHNGADYSVRRTAELLDISPAEAREWIHD